VRENNLFLGTASLGGELELFFPDRIAAYVGPACEIHKHDASGGRKFTMTLKDRDREASDKDERHTKFPHPVRDTAPTFVITIQRVTRFYARADDGFSYLFRGLLYSRSNALFLRKLLLDRML
jgi:hypothetical protein